MAAVKNLYNPFRDENAGDSQGGDANNNDKSDPFAAFTFEINQTVDFPSPDGLSTPVRTKHKKDAADPQSPDFDPFHVIVSPDGTTQQKEGDAASTAHKPKAAITPKLVVKLSTHEEVTSKMKMDLDDFDATSEVTIEGTVYVSTFVGRVVVGICWRMGRHVFHFIG